MAMKENLKPATGRLGVFGKADRFYHADGNHACTKWRRKAD